jgi:DNA (cytosine-5)-methyltransferase 1
MNIDLFAGPGGWDEGARMLGVTDIIGYEWDKAACLTAEAAGHKRIRGDLALQPVPADLAGLIASPPCQAWSTAGKGLGKLDKPRIMAHLERIRLAGRWLHYSREGWHDPRSPLVLEPLRYALLGNPEWLAFEQVPAVLPLWEAFAVILREHGYTIATGILSAEQYGVPQTRKRAILVGTSLFGPCGNVSLPAPTHQAYRKGRDDDGSGLPRWVSMAESLGWDSGSVGFPCRADTASSRAAADVIEIDGTEYRARDLRDTDEPAFVLTEKSRSWSRFPAERTYASGTMKNAARRHQSEPAPTVAFGHDSAPVAWHPEWPVGILARQSGATVRSIGDPAVTITGGVGRGVTVWTDSGEPYRPRQVSQTERVTTAEAARLQSFPADYPWQGSRTKQYEQIGNAIPPLLAAAVLGNLLGIDWHPIAHSMRSPHLTVA